MSVHRMVWRIALATAALVALAGTRVWMPIGPAVAMVLMAAVLLAVGAPGSVDLERRWLRGRLLPSQTELAVMADPDEALLRQREESTRLLRMASTPAELRLMLRLRERILDEVAQRSDGVLPDHVWALPEHAEHGWFARGT